MAITMPVVAAELRILIFLLLPLAPVVWVEVAEAPEKVPQVQHSKLLPVT
jgi:hypothetical protein